MFDAVTRACRRRCSAAASASSIALWSEGARERMSHVLRDHGLANLANVASWQDALALPKTAGRARGAGPRSRLRDRAGRDHRRAGHSRRPAGAAAPRVDAGPRISSPRRPACRPAISWCMSITASAASSACRPIEAAGAPHDCLELHYAGGDKLYLPVENIELLSRYGSEDLDVELDRLGGSGWQTRKARMKKRIREIAHELIKIAAERQIARGAEADGCARACTTNSAPASPTRRPRTSRPRSTRRSTISPPAGRWTGWSAAMSASARPRWRCARPSSRR